ncbi:uncharacterized protein B0H18DRAFT_1118588 [Fomitopsis serialis]|uniref:uncharacterized protein n=1 Tax=Fomitopsis serialis TaxID=139415 RepID=UPI0020083CD7|nr:uncharacterized protein B0H18DRAFT_1118588 [Neoantrodia serialis]KAH9927328.1 hypothetical protein B0H18DRAFT_1118588 [Neoantrodia serialis]
MQFTAGVVLALSALVGQAATVPTTLVQRQEVVPTHGTINAPAESAAIAPGATFDFDFASVNYCESGYEPITVYLFENEPDVSDLNTDGSFPESDYLYEFGQWLIPTSVRPPPPPSNLTMPDFSQASTNAATYSDATFYLTVVETYLDCPGDIAKEFGITTTSIVYNATTA